jgi:CheY-like chemotaxis protein
MNTLSICIADGDSIRSETIRETLIEETYSVVTCKNEVQALKTIVENSFDIIFFSQDLSMDPFNFVKKIKSFSPKSYLVVINSGPQNLDMPPLMFAELGIKHYIDTPITSMNYILDRVHSIESEIIREEDKLGLLVSLLDEAKDFASGKKKSTSGDAKKFLRKVGVLSNVFNSNNIEEGKIKGSIKETSYYDVVRILGSIYEEGMLEFTNESERALFIIKNKAVVSAFVSPGVRGIKAFLRVAQWSDGHFNFKNKIAGSYGVEHDIAYIELIRLCGIAKKTHEWFIKYRNNLPSKNLNLHVNTKIAGKNVQMTPKELDVLMTVVDHNRVAEILNYNSTLDTDIYESLINLRKKSAIEVRAQG